MSVWVWGGDRTWVEQVFHAAFSSPQVVDILTPVNSCGT